MNERRETRRRAERCGRLAESAVAAELSVRGFNILAQRVRTPCGELDLVAADAETLLFVEVKARRSLTEAAYAVQPRQQLRLRDAANAVLAANADWHRPAIRFDVALVSGGRIHHIEDAIRGD